MKNKFLNIVCVLIAIAVVGTSCEKGPQFRQFTYPAQVPSGLSPASGYPMTNVTITGTNFDTLKGAVKVWFGSIQATNIISVTGKQIVVQVPSNAVSGKVSLQVWTTKVDSVGTYTVIPAPVINSIASKNAQKNVAFPGDTLTMKGIRFGTDASKMAVSFNGTPATIITPVTDTMFKVIAPASFATGNVTLTIGGLTLTATPAIINPTAPGDVTPYFLSNYATPFARGSWDGSRWGNLDVPWVTNAAAKNKGGGLYGGWAKESWNGTTGFINWETWGNTPVTDGIVYQPTSMALPAGSYTVSFNYYSEIQTNSSVYCVVAAGGSGIPILANLSSALGYVALYNGAVVGTTKPNVTETKSFNFTLTSSQVVSLGFLGNMVGGSADNTVPGSYFIIKSIKLVKN